MGGGEMKEPGFETARAVVHAWPPEEVKRASLRLLGQPPLFDIEASGACNIHCSFCPRLEMARPGRVMTRETFAEVLRFLPREAVVMLSGLGDPLTNLHLEEFIHSLEATGISSCIVTNGLLLLPDRQRRLAAAGVSQIQVSYHAVSDATYESIITRGGDRSQLEANLDHLAANRPPGLRVRLNFVATPENAGELTAVEARADDLGFDLFVRRLHGRGGTIASPRAGPEPPGCGMFASVTFITAQGDVLCCVNDANHTGRMGHVSSLSWSALVASKRRVIEGGSWFEACRSCDDDFRWVPLVDGTLDSDIGQGRVQEEEDRR